jgi:alpha-L-arabinofuranosidase
MNYLKKSGINNIRVAGNLIGSVRFIFLTAYSFWGLCGQSQQTATVTIAAVSTITINKNIYGHFAEHLGRCIYDGIYRNGRINDKVALALKEIRVPVLRWPGGCFADEYHWKDGIGPKQQRPKRINTTWGMVIEDNSFGTDEFLKLCELIGCEPYISGNVGTGTPKEMAEWLEYLNFNGESSLADERRRNGHTAPYKVSFLAVGNESWGCGGDMSPEYYASEYKKFANFSKTYPGSPRLKKIAGGANSDDYNWTEVLMKNIPTNLMWGLSLHYYTLVTGKWPPTGSATNFTEQEYFQAMKQALRMEEIVGKHIAIMDKYDPEKKVALVVDEWGIWTKAEPGTNPAFLYQQNSLRDALIAASTLNIFNNHCDRIRVANLAQTVNVLQALILTKGDSMLLTPTYHVFDLYKVHQDAYSLPVKLSSGNYKYNGDTISGINVSASKDSLGRIHISLVNVDAVNPVTVKINVGDIKWETSTGQILTSANFTDHNTFSEPNRVIIKSFTRIVREGNDIKIELPEKSIVMIKLK